MTEKRNLLILSICHLLVDGICISVVFGQSFKIWLLYGICAFSTQCFTGMLADRFGRRELILTSNIFLIWAIPPIPIALKTVLIGLGNSLFHVSGGHLCLKESYNMTPLGIFVAPGALGVFLGMTFPQVRIPFVVALIILSFMVQDSTEESDVCRMPEKEKFILAVMLLMAIATRAIGGSAVAFSWKTSLITSGLAVMAVFLGKTFGGVIGDRIGIRKIAIISTVTAAVLTIFYQDYMVLSLVGQFALNLSMPITLYLIYRLYPDSPGFAFGLAASALLPGTLIGMVINLTGIWENLLILICFAVGLAAMLITERRLQ